ncbi:extracellular metalloprotease [Xylaria sp. FL1777]|nr:extracellular metalloprotease [Xylaria sp. FL1777]
MSRSAKQNNQASCFEPSLTTKTTDVYYWYLNKSSEANNTPRYTQAILRSNSSPTADTESLVNSFDGRSQVDLKDYDNAEGKFRAIVKLFLLYEGQTKGKPENEVSWATATGWLISRDVVVTAGDCAFNHSNQLGRLVKVQALVGYTGPCANDKSEPNFKSRWGTAVATSPAWVDTDEGSPQHDVSFIKLSRPFGEDEVKTLFSWIQTPHSQKAANLGVVGYPGDTVDEFGDRGTRMYEMFKKTDYDLDSTTFNVLEYQIDTYGGNSGCPVFNDRESLRAIGVHVLGGYKFNSASVISGSYGNSFEAYLQVASGLDDEKKKDGTQPSKDRPWLWLTHLTTIESANDDPVTTTITKAKIVNATVPPNILDYKNPISYGPVAGPLIGILASAAITAAGRLAADSCHESDVQALANTRPYDGLLGRAILAECALQCFLNIENEEEQKQFYPFLGPVVAALKPFVIRIAPRLLKGILEPSMRLILASVVTSSSDTTYKGKKRKTPAELDTGFGRKLTDEEDTFLTNLMKKVEDDSQAVKSFYSTSATIGDVIGGAFKKAGPILTDVARIGLPLLLDPESSHLEHEETHLDPLAHRAILAEACLQAYIYHAKDTQDEQTFPDIVKYLKDFGPKIMRASPFVARFMGPVVADILRELNDKKRHREFLKISQGK